MQFSMTSAGVSVGNLYTPYDLANVFEVTVGNFSFPTDVVWGAEAEQTNRSELSLYINEASRESYEDAYNQHHFRGWFDSTEIASYLYYMSATPAVISTAITTQNAALVRWYNPTFVFTEPVTFSSGTVTFSLARSGIPVPLYPCVYPVSVVTSGASAIDLVFAGTSANTTYLAGLAAADRLFFEGAVVHPGGTTIITANTQYTVTTVTLGTWTVRISATHPALTAQTITGGRVVFPKWRLKMDVRMRMLTDGVTNFKTP